MENVQIPLQLAPESLYQPILPGWQFNLFSVNLGASSNAENEKATIQEVGSYGKQIGHLAEALEVVIRQLDLLDSKGLPKDERTRCRSSWVMFSSKGREGEADVGVSAGLSSRRTASVPPC